MSAKSEWILFLNAALTLSGGSLLSSHDASDPFKLQRLESLYIFVTNVNIHINKIAGEIYRVPILSLQHNSRTLLFIYNFKNMSYVPK